MLALVIGSLEYWPKISGIWEYLWTVATDVYREMLDDLGVVNVWLRSVDGKMEEVNQHLRTMEMYAIGQFELIRDEIVSRIQESVNGGTPLPLALAAPAGAMEFHFDLRGATIADDATAERLAQRIGRLVTDRIRGVTR